MGNKLGLALVLTVVLPVGISIAKIQPVAVPQTPPGSREVRLHDFSTIVKDRDEYWIFYTGRGIPSYRSKDLVHWERGPQTIREAPAWASAAVPGNRGMDYWAPDVRRIGNEYFL